MIKNWKRRCQECWHVQLDIEPPKDNKKKMDAWLDHKCKKCGSMGLDYGHKNDLDESC